MDSTLSIDDASAEIYELLVRLAQHKRAVEEHYRRWPYTFNEPFPGGEDQRANWRQLCEERDRVVDRLTAIAVNLFP